ncbi:hypothetical protein HCH_02463 [Hahella chejuensis KCTC 2396]|uniref:Uncharacterized protein n=1 Tax=Hahella chejuensis (strain KCTC 2396) TaxID=349521 RepID=Q2SJA4_HAHCH|nr:hypothetical protein HCH_02463 [Hahella chejuensis KCTC 2396]
MVENVFKLDQKITLSHSGRIGKQERDQRPVSGKQCG